MRFVIAIIMTIGKAGAWCAVFGMGAGFLASLSMVVYSFAGQSGVVITLGIFFSVCGYLGWRGEHAKKKGKMRTRAEDKQSEDEPFFSSPAPARPEVPLLYLPDVSERRGGSRTLPR
jgi:hypothetical protein